MTEKVISHLQEILRDLSTNRQRLVEQMDQHKLQHDVNVTQLDRFDTIIASVQHSLGDSAAIADIETLRNAPPPPEAPAAPLGDAGAGDPPAPAPAG